MIRICFVCHGNICRSPMAEFIMKDLVRRSGKENEFLIRSAATHDDEIIHGIGNPIYPPAQRKLRSEGVPFSDRQAVRLRKQDYDNYDYFFCMDDENIACIHRIFGGDPDNKVYKLPVFTGTGDRISDPWFTGDFDLAYDDIRKGCVALLAKLNGDLLQNYRNEIDRIDCELAQLFEERMRIVKEISVYKSKNRIPVLDACREKEILDRCGEYLTDPSLVSYYRDFVVSLISISKEYQRDLTTEDNRSL